MGFRTSQGVTGEPSRFLVANVRWPGRVMASTSEVPGWAGADWSDESEPEMARSLMLRLRRAIGTLLSEVLFGDDGAVSVDGHLSASYSRPAA